MSERVGVVGGGIMGAGIAEVAARAGCDVLVREVDEAAADRARARIARSLERAVTAERLTAGERDAALGRVRCVTGFDEFADRDVVIEAVVEDESLKAGIFRTLDEVTSGTECLLASNTSSIPIMRLAAVTARPERVIGLHFFNPVPVLPLVEVIPHLATPPVTLERARAFAADRLGKQTVTAPDRSGFVVNALLVPFLLSAVRMVEAGLASATDVDAAMVAGCAHPIGPLALIDLIGLDTTAAVADSMYAEYREPLYAPPPLLRRMVEGGRLGRKSGQGFHSYE